MYIDICLKYMNKCIYQQMGVCSGLSMEIASAATTRMRIQGDEDVAGWDWELGTENRGLGSWRERVPVTVLHLVCVH